MDKNLSLRLKSCLTLIVLINLIIYPLSEAFACDISGYDITAIKQAHIKFRNHPDNETAQKYLELIPDSFCEFEQIFGYTEKAGPLYETQLYETLPKLEVFIPYNQLLSKFLSLASNASWDADNVNYLQDAYFNLLLKDPKKFIGKIMLLPETERKIAIKFLFDGPHPSKTFLNKEDKNTVCEISKKFCEELLNAETELNQQEKDEH